MKITVFGAGAIGSYLAAALTKAGADVSLIARGHQLEAIREKGLTLKTGDESFTARPFATGDPEEVGCQDYVFVALKSHLMPDAAPAIAKLMGPETALITAMNGIPYWYFYGMESPWRDRTIEAVDPGGMLWRSFPPRCAIGCVLYPWAEMLAPGVVEQHTSNRFIIGEPDGAITARIQALSAVMQNGGLDAPIATNIRDELWGKLWGNLSLNPLSALTGATIDRLAFDPELRLVGRAMMVEAESAARALGVTLPMSVDERLVISGAAGAKKTSMLHDLQRGKSLEIEPLLGAVVELGGLVGEEMPLCRHILALTRERGRNRLP